MANTYNRMLLNRIRTVIDPLLRPNQNLFRQNRTTVRQILAIRRIIEGVKSTNLTAIITFIDFKKAFDFILRGKMAKVLQSYGISDMIVNAINISYANTISNVCTPDYLSEKLDILAGTLLGNNLAPYLFIVLLDYELLKAINGHEE